MRHLRLLAIALGAVMAILVFATSAMAQLVPVVAYSSIGSIDPAYDWDSFWQVEFVTGVNLYTYRDDAGGSGTKLIPEAATGLPTVSTDGKTYTFTIKPGFGFSPPSTEQVTAASFARAIERTAGDYSPAQFLTDNIAGFDEYLAGGGVGSISGIAVSGNQLTIHLIKADGSFVAKLAQPFLAAVPVATPMDTDGLTAIPSGGPYYIDPSSVTTASSSVTGLSLLVNPNYGGARPAPEFSRIDVSAQAASQAIASATAGSPTVDVVNGIPSGDRAALASSYGPGSAAADAGHQQYFSIPVNGISYLYMNTTRITDTRVRRAIATAIDRTQLATDMGQTATDQYVPPTMGGFVDRNLFSLTGDVAAGQALMAQAGYGPSNHLAVTMLINSSGSQATVASDVQSELASIYVDVTLESHPLSGPGGVFAIMRTNSSPWELSLEAWLADYNDIFDMTQPLLATEMIQSFNGGNLSHFSDPAVDANLDYNNNLDVTARLTALENQADDVAQNAAPMAAVGVFQSPELVSTRVACIVNQPAYLGLDLLRLCSPTTVDPNVPYTEPGQVSTAEPVKTAVTSPSGGNVSVVQTSAPDSLTGFQIVGQQLVIEAPAATPSAPLQLTFTVEAATLQAAGLTKDTVQVVRNGVAAANCLGSSTASPDPCVSARGSDGSGNAVLTVLTSHASTWSFASLDTTPPTLTTFGLDTDHITPGGSVVAGVTAAGGAVAGEFFVDWDLGAGLNTPMNGSNGTFSIASIGSALAAGNHTIGVRVRDEAGNWSSVSTRSLFVGLPTSTPPAATPPAAIPPVATPPVATPPAVKPFVLAAGTRPTVKLKAKTIVVFLATGTDGSATVALTTKAGKRLVFATTTLSAAASRVVLKLPAHLKPGVYLVQISATSGSSTAKKTLQIKLVK